MGGLSGNTEALAQLLASELAALVENDNLATLFHPGVCFPGHSPLKVSPMSPVHAMSLAEQCPAPCLEG